MSEEARPREEIKWSEMKRKHRHKEATKCDCLAEHILSKAQSTQWNDTTIKRLHNETKWTSIPFGEKVWFGEAVLGFYLSCPFSLLIPSVCVHTPYTLQLYIISGAPTWASARVRVFVCLNILFTTSKWLTVATDFFNDLFYPTEIRCFYVYK